MKNQKKIFLILCGLFALHLLLIDSALLALSEAIPVTSQWKNAGDFLRWIGEGTTRGADQGLPFYLLGVGIILFSLVFLQLSRGLLSLGIEWVFERPLRGFFSLALFLSILFRYYLFPGPFTESGDASAHLMHLFITRDALAHGTLPTWSNWVYCGSPFLQDYGPLFFYLTATLSLLLNHFEFSVKLALFLFHVASGLLFFYALSPLFRNRLAPLTGALCYVLIGWHSHYLLIQGRFPAAPIYLFLPLLFRETHRLASSTASFREDLATILKFALWTGLLFATHFIYPVQTGLFLALYASILIAAQVHSQRRVRPALQVILKLSLASFLGLLLASGFLLPFLLEKEGTMAAFHMGHDMGSPRRTFSMLAWMLWNNSRFPILEYSNRYWGDAYFGIIPILFSVAALLFLIRQRKSHPIPTPLAAIAITTFAVFAVILFWPVLGSIPLVKRLYITECERYQLPLLFCFSLFVTFLVGTLHDRFSEGEQTSRFNRLLPLLPLLILIDLGSLTFQTPYGLRSEWDQFQKMAETFKTTTARKPSPFLPTERVYYEGMSLYDYTLKGAPMSIRRANHPTFQGSYGQGAPLSYLLIDKMYPEFERCIENKPTVTLSPRLIKFLRLTYTPILILRDSDRLIQGGTIGRIERIPGEKTIVHLKFPGALATTNRLESPSPSWPDSAKPLFAFEALVFMDSTSQCSGVVAHDAAHAGQTSEDRALFNVKTFEVGRKTVQINGTTDHPTYLLLPFSWHPALAATINGQTARPIRLATGFTALKLEQGTSDIILEGGLSQKRMHWGWFSCAVLAMLLVGLLVFRRQ